ncbi:hypothetical protein LY625_06950 [Lysobacter sp. GX 14042]|uniref:hypothetical protein n=1 Tax=Lysobacter sp. GX 14042 TaxID=2907155 RepID=UPI001F1C0A0B|nr:hypothetical protein [Lysobacter sp. GX 14042]MCE7032360.1 hypothetical protein [Lysobacter sp. GX 14042]
MQHIHRRYMREFGVAMSAYVLVLVASITALNGPLASAGPAVRAVVALLPVLPVGLVLRAVLRYVRDEDELQRRIDSEAIAIAALVVGLGTFSLGMLAAADVLTVSGDWWLWILPAMFAVFGLAKFAAVRRYR